MQSLLLEYIRLLLEESGVLGEPDFTGDEEKEERQEQGVPGATTPLGTCAQYPDKCPKKPMTPAQAAGSGFGDAKPMYSKKRK